MYPHPYDHYDCDGEERDAPLADGTRFADPGGRSERERAALALDEAYAEADAWHRERDAAWLAQHPDLDLGAEADAAHEGSEREARERRP